MRMWKGKIRSLPPKAIKKNSKVISEITTTYHYESFSLVSQWFSFEALYVHRQWISNKCLAMKEAVTGMIFSLQTLVTTEVRLYCLIIPLPPDFPFE